MIAVPAPRFQRMGPRLINLSRRRDDPVRQSYADPLRRIRPGLPDAPGGIVIHRQGAIGDVIGVAAIAQRLGCNVQIDCHAECGVVLDEFHPFINTRPLPRVSIKARINLDNAYELHPYRRLIRRGEIFHETVRNQLAIQGITIGSMANCTAILRCQADVLSQHKRSRPWIVVAGTSNSFANRTITGSVWTECVRQISGTLFWLGTDSAPTGLVDLRIRSLNVLVKAIVSSDAMISVDTGPMHIGGALGIPLVIVKQCVDPWLAISTEQRDYSVVITKTLGCLNCQELRCPIDGVNPPCSRIDPAVIVDGVNAKLRSLNGKSISAVIPVYMPSMERLARCIECVRDQVKEIVVAIDGRNSFTGPVAGARLVDNPYGIRTGVGRTFNRAIRETDAEFVLLLNDDVFLKPNAVALMKDAMISDGRIGIVGCRLWYPDGTIQHGGGFRRSGDIGWGHLDHLKTAPTLTQRTPMEFVTLACALVRRKAFYDVMGFDEEFDCYNEDADMCLSMKALGWKIVYEPSAEGIHLESQTTRTLDKDALLKASQAVLREKWGWLLQ